jgi:hypothetical protein
MTAILVMIVPRMATAFAATMKSGMGSAALIRRERRAYGAMSAILADVAAE